VLRYTYIACPANSLQTKNSILFKVACRTLRLKCDGTREQKQDFVFRRNGRVYLNR